MTYVADDVLLERLTQKETYLSIVFDALEAKASYLLAFIAVLAGLPAVLADKISLYWGKWTLLGSITLVCAIFFAAAAAAAVLWVIKPETYKVEETEELVSWRDNYVQSQTGCTDEQKLSNAIRGSLIRATANRIKHNQTITAEKVWRLQAAYYATAVSAIANLLLLIPIAVHYF